MKTKFFIYFIVATIITSIASMSVFAAITYFTEKNVGHKLTDGSFYKDKK